MRERPRRGLEAELVLPQPGPWALPLLIVAVAAVSAATTAVLVPSSDARLFVAAGRRLLTRDGLDVFDNPVLQTGPAHLVVTGLVATVARVARLDPAVAAIGGLAALAAGLIAVLPVPRVERVALLATCLLCGPFSLIALDGHPEELLVVATLLLAAGTAARGRGVPAGLLLGLAGAWKPWGVLGVPLLLLLTGWRARSVAAGAAAVVLVAAYLPFFAFGDVQTLDFVWHAGGASPMELVLGNGATYGWGVRLVQGAVVLAVGSVIALRARQRPGAWAAVPAAVVAARLLTDPDLLAYYWAAAAVAAFCVVWTQPDVPVQARLRNTVVVFLVATLLMVVPDRTGAVLVLVGLCGAIVALFLVTRRQPAL